MTKIIWTDSAVKDLEHISEYISLDSEVYARALINDIFIAIDRLEFFPKSGRTVQEDDKGSYRWKLPCHLRD